MQGVCGSAHCWNVEGSFTCECENGQEEFDPLTRQCVNRESAGNTNSHTTLLYLKQEHSNSVSVLPSTGNTRTPANNNNGENNNSINKFTLYCCHKGALQSMNIIKPYKPNNITTNTMPLFQKLVSCLTSAAYIGSNLMSDRFVTAILCCANNDSRAKRSTCKYWINNLLLDRLNFSGTFCY